MHKQSIPSYRRSHHQQSGSIRTTTASILLLFGTMLGRFAQSCTDLGRLWLGERDARLWTSAFRRFSAGSLPSASRIPGWERWLLRVAPPIILAVVGTFALLGLLLLLGSAAIWLLLHGFWWLLMLGALFSGLIVGGRRAALNRRLPHNEELN